MVQRRLDAAALSDADVIAASLDDPDLFRLIVSRHGGAVLAYAARRVGRQDARDVASEVFLRGFRLRNRYEGLRETCLPWLYRIARNVVGEWLKRTNRKDTIALVLNPPAGGFEDDVLDRVVAASVIAELRGALELLADRDRETLLLFALDGLTYGEIAASLGIPPGTVGSRLTRARNDIRTQVPDLERKTNLLVRPVTEPSVLTKDTLESIVAFRVACQWFQHWIDGTAAVDAEGAADARRVLEGLPEWQIVRLDGLEAFYQPLIGAVQAGDTVAIQYHLDINCPDVRRELPEDAR